MRYNIGAGVAGQYVFNPCDGLWTAGDVCPEILDCAVQEKMGTGETVFPDEENACKITGLPGWGYNPSVVPAPRWLRERAKWQLGLSDKVAFVATSRVKASNKPVACLNPKVVDWDIRRRANATASDLVLLDAHWNILFSMPIRGGHCEDNPESVQDARLFLAGGTEAGNETIFVTYPNPTLTRTFTPPTLILTLTLTLSLTLTLTLTLTRYMTYKGTRSTDAKQAFGSSECEGHWMSTLRLPLGPRVSSPSP